MSGPGANAGSSAGDAIRKGVGMVHGVGEAIRGNINAAVDSAAGDRESAAKNQSIASRGADEMDRGHRHNTGAAVTTDDSHIGTTTHASHSTGLNQSQPHVDSELALRRTQTDGPSPTYEPYDTNVDNKQHIRFNEDLDHRSTVHGPSYGPSHSNVGRGLDSNYQESDRDHRRTVHQCLDCGSTNIGTRTANIEMFGTRYNADLDHHGTRAGHHSPDYGARGPSLRHELDPTYDSGLDYRGTQPGATSYVHHDRNINHKQPGSRYEPSLDRGGSRDYYNDATTRPQQPVHHEPPVERTGQGVHNSTILNKLDPRIDSTHGTRRF